MLITGASLEGIGRILAHIHSLHGAEVAIADLLPLEKAAEECRKLGAARVVCVQFDAGKEGDSIRMVEEVAAQMTGGVIDDLYLNHNLGVFSPMLEQKDLLETARRNTRVNYFGYIEIAHAAQPFLLDSARARDDKKKSTIMVISSLAAAVPMLNTHCYAASKAAISAWFKCLRLELRSSPELSKLLSVCIMNFSAVKTKTLISALGGEGGVNKKVLAIAADPVETSWATVCAAMKNVPNSYFPSSVGALPIIYSVWPWLGRQLVNSVPTHAVAKLTTDTAP